MKLGRSKVGIRAPRSVGFSTLRILLAVVALTLVGFPVAQSASADWEDEGKGFVIESGNYVAFGFNWIDEEFSSKVGQSSTDKGFHNVDGNVKNAKGLNLLFGRRANGFFAIEGQFDYAQGFQFTDDDGDDFDLKVYTVTINAKIFPFHEALRPFNEGRLQPYLVGGFGLMTTKDLDIDTGASAAFRFGGGFDYHINNTWAFNTKISKLIPVGQLSGLKY
ncbi:MAG: hypothetical protein ACI8TQ_004020, partial [Planctomycetota bacterium]